MPNWTVTFDFPNASQEVTQGWSATWTQSGTRVSAASMSWNGSLGKGASTSIGFTGSWSGANPVPASFALNGTTCTGSVTPPPTDPPPSGPAPKLHVSGNKIVTASGEPYRLLGVDRSSGEYACVQGKGQWDGGSPSGATYQQGVKDYVDLLVANGINVILDLHWTWGAYTNGPDWHCKDATATCQKPTPDAEYAPQFWTGVANVFKSNDAVVFDLFNEPYPEIGSDWDKTLGWQ